MDGAKRRSIGSLTSSALFLVMGFVVGAWYERELGAVPTGIALHPLSILFWLAAVVSFARALDWRQTYWRLAEKD